MRVNSITIDNFYEDPMMFREFALKQEFKVRGNHPGQRTVSFLAEKIKKPRPVNPEKEELIRQKRLEQSGSIE